MNQKKAKSIRRTMRRLFGRDPREAVAQKKSPVMGIFGGSFNYSSRRNEGGVPYVHFSGQHALESHCGRAEYQNMKRDYKAAKQRGETLLGPAWQYSPDRLDAQTELAA